MRQHPIKLFLFFEEMHFLSLPFCCYLHYDLFFSDYDFSSFCSLCCGPKLYKVTSTNQGEFQLT